MKNQVDELWQQLIRNRQTLSNASKALTQVSKDHHAAIEKLMLDTQAADKTTQDTLFKLRWDMIERWLDYYPAFGPLIAEAVLAIKKELGIKVAPAKYKRVVNDAFADTLHRIRKHLDEARSKETAVK